MLDQDWWRQHENQRKKRPLTSTEACVRQSDNKGQWSLCGCGGCAPWCRGMEFLMAEKEVLGEKSFICRFILHRLKAIEREVFFLMLTFLSGVPNSNEGALVTISACLSGRCLISMLSREFPSSFEVPVLSH